MSAPPPVEPAYFPVFLRLDGCRVLVVGGGDPAAAKARLLLPTGADIFVVDAAPGDAVIELAAAGRIRLATRDFEPDDLVSARLCIVALDDAVAAAAVAVSARAAGVLTNVVDQPTESDCIVPAMVERGPVTVAIGTAGVAPALARDLRSRVEAALPPSIATLAALCRDWRSTVAEALPDRVARRQFWDAVLAGPEAQAALNNKPDEAARHLARRLAGQTPQPRGQITHLRAAGDVELLTLRDMRALQRADVVCYDARVDPAVLGLARRDARQIDLSRDSRPDAIDQVILQLVQAGSHVVILSNVIERADAA